MGAWPLPRLIAHRGGGALAPENTLAGIREAARRGFRAVEFDVMLCADGVPVLLHDQTLERTTDGHGRVCDLSFAQLSGLDAGGSFARQFAGEPIPRFDQALEQCRSLGLAANVEIKPADGAERDTGRIVGAWALEHGGDIPLILSSFSLAALEEAQKAAPDLPRGVLFGDPPVDWLGIVQRAGAVSMHCAWTRLRAEILAAAQAAGVELVVYTCNDPQQALRLLGDGVSSVITDALDRMSGAGEGDL